MIHIVMLMALTGACVVFSVGVFCGVSPEAVLLRTLAAFAVSFGLSLFFVITLHHLASKATPPPPPPRPSRPRKPAAAAS